MPASPESLEGPVLAEGPWTRGRRRPIASAALGLRCGARPQPASESDAAAARCVNAGARPPRPASPHREAGQRRRSELGRGPLGSSHRRRDRCRRDTARIGTDRWRAGPPRPMRCSPRAHPTDRRRRPRPERAHPLILGRSRPASSEVGVAHRPASPTDPRIRSRTRARSEAIGDDDRRGRPARARRQRARSDQPR